MDAASLFEDIPLVPVVTLEDAASAVPLAVALQRGGIRCLEITLRTDAAMAAIEQVARALPEMLVGAGSVRVPEQLRRAQGAGAGFAVSPGSSARLLAATAQLGLPFVPGAATATEIMGLLEHGYRLQKFFPAEASGGLARLRALAAPLPEVRFFPTGGLSAALAREYLALEAVACVGGSWFVPADAVRAGDFARITALAAEAVTEAARARAQHRR